MTVELHKLRDLYCFAQTNSTSHWIWNSKEPKSHTSATSSRSHKAIFDLPGALFHNEPSYKTFNVKISLICVKMDQKAAHIFVCFRTKTRFDIEAIDNSEMVYWLLPFVKCYRRRRGYQVVSVRGRVVQKPVNVNPGLNVNWSITFSYLKIFIASNVWCSLKLLQFKTEGQIM